jgi:hypothetical protein
MDENQNKTKKLYEKVDEILSYSEEGISFNDATWVVSAIYQQNKEIIQLLKEQRR